MNIWTAPSDRDYYGEPEPEEEIDDSNLQLWKDNAWVLAGDTREEDS